MATNKTRIGIRHGSGAPVAGANGLLPYELGWDGTNYALYISNNGTIEKVGGRGLFLPLTGGTLSDSLAVKKAGEVNIFAYNTSQNHNISLCAGGSGRGGIYDYTHSKWVVYSDISGNVVLNGNAVTATTATTATQAYKLLKHNSNECTIGSGGSAEDTTNSRIWFNYRSCYGGAIDDAATKLTGYYFGNRKGSVTDVVLYADGFDGSTATLSGTLHFKNITTDNYTQGIRLHPSTLGWNALTFCGTDNTGDSGTSANTWGLFTHNGNFYIGKNGCDDATTYLKNVNGVWYWNGTAIGDASSARDISTGTPVLATSTEYNEITVKDLGNSRPVSGKAMRHGINFRWYTTNWIIGNLRGGSTDSAGLGFAYSSDSGSTYANKLILGTNGGLYFGESNMNREILAYSSTAPKYGIWYKDASVNTMRFSASGNADTDTGADLCINGAGDGTVTIRGKSIITSSDTMVRKIWVTASASTPVGAVNGDIVLVKVT